MKTVLLAALLSIPIQAFAYEQNRLPDPFISWCIMVACAETGIDYQTGYRLAEWESGWNIESVHKNWRGTGKKRWLHSTDYGLFHLNSLNADDFSWKYNGGDLIDVFDALTNARVALRHLSALRKRFGSLEVALAAYNCGADRVKVKPWPADTVALVNFVLGRKG